MRPSQVLGAKAVEFEMSSTRCATTRWSDAGTQVLSSPPFVAYAEHAEARQLITQPGKVGSSRSTSVQGVAVFAQGVVTSP